MRQTVRSNPSECTGCGACVSICSHHAIFMQANEEGFLYPVVDASLCVECNLCEKRCPVTQEKPWPKQSAYGAYCKQEEIREMSSSGGIFVPLAEEMLKRGGVVFGAVFDEQLLVETVGAFSPDEVREMCGSKYLQSAGADAIGNAVALLKKGVPVLFSGTPCQIAGLRAAAGEKFAKQLITVDFVCHGVPSPGVFRSYLNEQEKLAGQRIVRYHFRDKRKGWKDFSAVMMYEDGTEKAAGQWEDPFMRGFLSNLFLRPSCHQCRLQGRNHPADITIADLWGAQVVCPERDDDRGLSLVLVNSSAGRSFLEAVSGRIERFKISDTDALLRFNPSIMHPAAAHPKRQRFFESYIQKGFEQETVNALLKPPGRAEKALIRIKRVPGAILRRLGLGKR